jgi:hypothetical protein
MFGLWVQQVGSHSGQGSSRVNPPSANDLYRAAQLLAREGQPVFPCLDKDRGTKHRAKSPWTRNGYQDASADIPQIKTWWTSYRGAAIGLPTGVLWDVLDVDIKNGSDGRRHLHKLQVNGLLNGCKRVVKTPSGGFHLYFKAAPNTHGLTNKANRELGLDVRSAGGYVLAPPSYIIVFDDLGEYSYEGAYEDLGPTTGSTDEPLMWELILNALAPIDADTRKPIILPTAERRGIGGLREFVLKLREGERNNGLHWAVCRCIDAGIDPNELMDVALYTGLTEEETAKTINSAIARAGLTAGDLMTEAESLFSDE